MRCGGCGGGGDCGGGGCCDRGVAGPVYTGVPGGRHGSAGLHVTFGTDLFAPVFIVWAVRFGRAVCFLPAGHVLCGQVLWLLEVAPPRTLSYYNEALLLLCPSQSRCS